MEQNFIKFAIEKAEIGLVQELKEAPCTLSFIRATINDALDLPESVSEQTKEQREIGFKATLDFICHLLKDKGCVAGNMIPDVFVEWHLLPEETVEKVRSEFIRLGENASPADEPWFKIKKETK